MNLVIWLLAGAALGLLVSIGLQRRRSSHILNIITGMVGAFLAGYLIAPFFRINTLNSGGISLPAFLVSMTGAAIFLAIFNFIRRENNIKDLEITSKWVLISDKIPTRWGKISEEDVQEINGDYPRFVAMLQKRYGFTEVEAEDQIQRYLKSVINRSALSFISAAVKKDPQISQLKQ